MTMGKARYWFQKPLGPLVWLAGLAMITYYAPAANRMLKLVDGENIVGFLGHSHELLTILDSNPATAQRLTWRDREYPAIGGRVSALLAHTTGDRVCIHDLDHDTNRLLLLERLQPIYLLASCGGGRRLCIEHGSEKQHFLSIVDTRTGRVIRTVPAARERWTLSTDGRRLAYHDESGQGIKFICIDVDDGRLLYTQVLPGDGEGFVSPDGKYVAISKFPFLGGYVIDVAEKRRVSTFTEYYLEVFSPDSRWLSDSNADVWDLGSHRIICSARLDSVFADRGRKIASIYSEAGSTRVKFLDLDTHEEYVTGPCRPETSVPYAGESEHPPHLATPDADGNFVSVWGWRDPSQTLIKLHRVLEWLGYKQDPPALDCWTLLDARSGAILQVGTGELIAVSADGRYVVSGDEQCEHIKIYELPLHRSLLFIAIAGAAWTALVFRVRRWWRRRVSGQGDQPAETHGHL